MRERTIKKERREFLVNPYLATKKNIYHSINEFIFNKHVEKNNLEFEKFV